MSYKSSICAILFLLPLIFSTDDGFVFNGFNGSSGWVMDGGSDVLPNGILALGNAFYSSPFQMRNHSDGSVFSFSATFAFVIPPATGSGRDGIAFVLAPNISLSTVRTYGGGMFGLLSPGDNGNPSNHLLCIELDTLYNEKFADIDDNHVGIDANSLNSSRSSPAGYYTDNPFSDLHPLRLSSGREMQVWIDYDHGLMQLNVSLSLIPNPKPKHPLLAHNINLSQVFLDHMYVGFSSSAWGIIHGYFILGCSFKVNTKSAKLDYSKLPKVNASQSLVHAAVPPNTISRFMAHYSVLIGFGIFVLLLVAFITLSVRRCRYREIREDWEIEFGPHRFSYKDLFHATDGFKDRLLLGAGGFGKDDLIVCVIDPRLGGEYVEEEAELVLKLDFSVRTQLR
ncbi:hypothetical protein PR202_ga28433 [Eleusine coracana subsp. coracana]|uniref:Legume lectin domain-containing protein n=1 Tax=Eleusine coracana subsp. coracana TaxID=191504 RepID=A0AAV5DJG0_ELECO|nr:hypothetical protein PR202_ga28433 [Eleusine coracana subsp. coracana]